jgi:hypothetical protein
MTSLSKKNKSHNHYYTIKFHYYLLAINLIPNKLKVKAKI